MKTQPSGVDFLRAVLFTVNGNILLVHLCRHDIFIRLLAFQVSYGTWGENTAQRYPLFRNWHPKQNNQNEIHWRQVRNHTSACFIRWRYEMQAVIHVGEESEPYVKLLVQKRVDLAIKIVETWQTEQLKALLTEWKKDHPAELKAA